MRIAARRLSVLNGRTIYHVRMNFECVFRRFKLVGASVFIRGHPYLVLIVNLYRFYRGLVAFNDYRFLLVTPIIFCRRRCCGDGRGRRDRRSARVRRREGDGTRRRDEANNRRPDASGQGRANRARRDTFASPNAIYREQARSRRRDRMDH